ncbi:MAG: GTP-binding protein [Lachnospiraceae bacterium]
MPEEMNEVPVYLFTGFMDSGKTTLINNTLVENDFADGTPSLIIMCEDGDVEYDKEELAKKNISIVEIESKEEFTEEKIEELNRIYKPQQVFLEYNGTWSIADLMEMDIPDDWVVVQSLATVDATTFEMYLTNMRSMILDQLFAADVVIINRCTDDTPKGKFRSSIKGVNRKAQIVYEKENGEIDDREIELPFDLDADVIEISDADYAMWYMDALDNPKKYNGKKVHFTALVYRPDKLKDGIFVPGRFAMTCCIEDVTFIGFKCKYEDAFMIPHKSWIDLTAEIHVEFAKEYKGKGPVLYPVKIKSAQKPQDDLVYFS